MVELELVGLSEDGTRLVLADAAGDEFTVPMDDRLRAVVRGSRVRPGQLETRMESALRPRDIQARIRAGENPEAVAEVAQVPVERIMGYAVPVIAERQHMAERAQRSAVRRKNAEGPGQLLGDAVAERLRSRNVDPQTCEWDAWRREDGKWTVSARYAGEGGERTGRFVYDALGRYALADDDDARWLVGERVAEREQKRKPSGRRLSAVTSEYDAMLFDEEPTTDLTAVADVLGDDHEGPEQQQRTQWDTEDQEEHSARADEQDETDEAARVDDDDAHTEPRPKRPEPKPEKRGRRGRGRASVPSWDEIMFGQPKG
jgi:Protein of unknown function (DUF3071)